MDTLLFLQNIILKKVYTKMGKTCLSNQSVTLSFSKSFIVRLLIIAIIMSSLIVTSSALYRGDAFERNVFDANDFRYNQSAFGYTSDLTLEFNSDSTSEFVTFYAKAGKYADNDLMFTFAANNLEINPIEKHFIKISYKTNLQKQNQAITLKSTGNDICWLDGRYLPINNNSIWTELTVDLEKICESPSLAERYPKADNPNVNISFKFFGSHDRTLSYDQYLSIRYIAFFETAEEADAFTFDAMSDAKYRALFGLDSINRETGREAEIRQYLTEAEALKNSIITSETSVTVTGTKYYVSTSGDDSNDGKSPDRPWRTLDKVNTYSFNTGDGVFFKRGDTWRAPATAPSYGNSGLFTKAGVTYSAYGTGAKPTILGSVVGTGNDAWLPTGYDNIWVFKDTFLGGRIPANIVFNNETAWGIRVTEDAKNPGYRVNRGICFNGIDYSDNSALPFTGAKDLSGNLQYWYDSDTGALYMYCDLGNPGTYFDTMEICLSGNAIRSFGKAGTDGTVIDNLCMKYFANHGVSGFNVVNFTVQNCVIGFIGGNGLGNAIESWTNSDNFIMRNNYAYQCYDCAFTAQGNATDASVTIQNVKAYNNIAEFCNSGLEFWNGVSQENYDKGVRATMKNVDLYQNYTLYAGYGWSVQRPTKDSNFFYGGIGTGICDFSNVVLRENVNMFTTNLGMYARYITPNNTYSPNGGFELKNNTYILSDKVGAYRSTGLLANFKNTSICHLPANEYNIAKLAHYGVEVGSNYKIISTNYLPYAFNTIYDVLKGDINGDGVIAPDDLIILARYLAVYERGDLVYLEKNADVDGDGSITPLDVTVLARNIAYGD